MNAKGAAQLIVRREQPLAQGRPCAPTRSGVHLAAVKRPAAQPPQTKRSRGTLPCDLRTWRLRRRFPTAARCAPLLVGHGSSKRQAVCPWNAARNLCVRNEGCTPGLLSRALGAHEARPPDQEARQTAICQSSSMDRRGRSSNFSASEASPKSSILTPLPLMLSVPPSAPSSVERTSSSSASPSNSPLAGMKCR